jgi:Tol biopolymer transport system component
MLSPRDALLLVLVAVCTTAAHAAQYPPSYRWQTITTDHFEIHYHQGGEDLARRAAAIAEAAHERLVPIFGWEPKDRTQLVLTDHVDVSNGFATPFPFNRIEVYVSAPGADPSTALEHYDDWLHLVITHEYAHILHLDMVRSYPRLLRRIFGRTPLSFPNMLSPLWLLEGIATLVESEATEAGRLKGTFVEMVLRTAAIEGRFATEPQAAGLTPGWPGGGQRYYYGSAFLAWLARTRGRETLTQYFHDYAGRILPYRVNASARAVWGENMSALWREWSDEIQAAYRDEHHRLSSAGLTERERLTTLGFQTKYPAISPDGTRIAYAHHGAYEWPTLRVRDLETGEDAATVRVNTISPLSWSPDGEWIAFSQLEIEGSFALLSDLYLWNPETSEVRRLTRGARLKSPAFTPGGEIVAVRNEAGRNRLVVVDAESGAIRTLLDPGDMRQFSEPDLHPDGIELAVAEWQDGRIDVVIYDLDGTRLRNLTESFPRSTNASPRYTADGRTIWFTSDVSGISNIHSVEVETGEIRRHTNLYGGGFFPSTIDGRDVYYVDYSSEGFDLARFAGDAEWPVERAIVSRGITGGELAVERIPVPEPLVEVEERPYSPWRTLRPQWWMPIFGGTSDGRRSETFLGAYTLGTDSLGFHQYDVQIMSRITEEADGEIRRGLDYAAVYSYDRLHPTLTLGAVQYADTTGLRIVTDGRSIPYSERIRRVTAQARFPYNRYRWQAAATVGAIQESVRADSLGLSAGQLASVGLFEGTLHGARIAVSFNNARLFGYSISPENGVTAIADFQTLDGERSLRQGRADVRGYLSVPVEHSPLGRHVAAGRLSGGWTEGDFLLGRELKIGGLGSGGFLTVNATNFPVRGFPSGTIRGQNAMLASLEYRFPLYEIERGPSIWPIFFHRLSGGVFVDAGTAWNRRGIELAALSRPEGSPWTRDTTIASVGTEVALDLFAGYYVPLRYRLGVALGIAAPPCPAPACNREGNLDVYLALGRSF